MKRVTVKDIARKADVSLGTVSRVLNGEKTVKEKNRKAVMAAIDGLNYKMNRIAQSLARNSIQLGIIIPNAWQQYFGPIREGIMSAVRELEDYNVTAIFREFNPLQDRGIVSQYIDEFIQNDVNGIILCPYLTDKYNRELKILNEKGIPYVLVGTDFLDVGPHMSVNVDSYLAGNLAADFCALTCKEDDGVAVLTGNKEMLEHRMKVNGFLEGAKRNHLNVCTICETQDDPEIAYLMTERALERYNNIRMIYVATDNSLSPCNYLRDSNKGDCVKLIVTNLFPELREYIETGMVLATIFQWPGKYGDLAVKALYKFITNGTGQDERHLVTPNLMLRSDMLAWILKAEE